MKIGGSERLHIEMIILEYQHYLITDKRVINEFKLGCSYLKFFSLTHAFFSLIDRGDGRV